MSYHTIPPEALLDMFGDEMSKSVKTKISALDQEEYTDTYFYQFPRKVEYMFDLLLLVADENQEYLPIWIPSVNTSSPIAMFIAGLGDEEYDDEDECGDDWKNERGSKSEILSMVSKDYLESITKILEHV